MDIIQALAEELKIRRGQAEAAVKLIDEGNTIPFIARYRKEATGSLNDEVLRSLGERLRYLRNLEERKNQVMEVIKEQGAMTQELQAKLMNAGTLVEVEDLYRPYKPKRRTRAMIAKERGLEPLADILALQQLKRPAARPLRRRRPISRRIRAWRTRRRPWPGRETSWRSGFPTTLRAEVISAPRPLKREAWSPGRRSPGSSRSMKCTMIMRSR